MAKRKPKQSKEEIEADRIAAHEEAASVERRSKAKYAELTEDKTNAPFDYEGSEEENPEELGNGEPPVEVDEEAEKEPTSVVAAKYKDRYAENARANGVSGKAAKRSNWDWLSQEIAKLALTKEGIDINVFCALLEANGVEKPMERWPNQNRGWEGRLRMTGRVVLQKIVAEAGALKLPDGSEVAAPSDWREKYVKKATE